MVEGVNISELDAATSVAADDEFELETSAGASKMATAAQISTYVRSAGGGGTLASPTVTGTVSGGATYTSVILTSPTISGATVSGSTFSSPTISGTVSGGATYSSVILTSPAISGTVSGGATYSSVRLTGTVAGGATYSSIILTTPTISSPAISGTVSGGATYTSAILTSPAISGTVTGGATYSSIILTTPALGTPASGVLTACTVATAATFTNSTLIASTAYGDRIGVQQVVSTITGAVATGTTVIPTDDTIPQNTEGDQYMTLAITPKSATSKLIIDVTWYGASSAAPGQLIAALFQDSTANALAAAATGYGAASNALFVKFTHVMTSGTTSATTFKVRAGGNGAGTTTFNGQGAARNYGGVLASSIVIKEIGS